MATAYSAGTVSLVDDGMVVVTNGGDEIAEDLDDITVYTVDVSASGTDLDKADADALYEGARVHMILNDKGNAITTIYIIEG